MTIHLECDNDQTLVMALGIARRDTVHHRGKGPVAKALRKETELATGIVDADPGDRQPTYFDEFLLEKEGRSLRLFKHRQKDKQLGVIRPDLEGWRLEEARTAEVSPKDFCLPESAKELHLIGKKMRDRFADFIKALHGAAAPGIVQLSKWLRSS